MKMTAVQNWKAMVEAEHAQTERLRDPAPPPTDHWQGLADRFRSDPFRSDDPLLELLTKKVESQHTLIDVGAGAGRLALSLALRCRHVVAVEPSPSMAEAFLEEAASHNISNVSLVRAGWEEAEVEPARVVLCSHVFYTVKDIGTFVRKLEAHAQEWVCVVIFREPPQRRLYPLWERVHGEERLWLPSFPQFKEVLRELRIEGEMEDLPPQDPAGFNNLEEAWNQLRGRLFLTEGSPKDRLLGQVLAEELEEFEGDMRLRGSPPMEPVLVSWKPASKE